MAEVRVWNSFSSNNSSAYRLVARFSDSTRAAETEAELRRMLGDQPSAPEAPRTLAEALGFDWEEVFPYGADDDPTLVRDERVLALFHSYCLGFPPELTSWLKARGATVEDQAPASLQLSVLFQLPTPGDDLGLKAIFGKLDLRQPRSAEGYFKSMPVVLPWSPTQHWVAHTAFFCDGVTLAMYVPTSPAEVPLLEAWLAARGVTGARMRLCEYDDAAKFASMASARCSACQRDETLRYLAPDRFGLDDEQLCCTTCGAMFELSALSPG